MSSKIVVAALSLFGVLTVAAHAGVLVVDLAGGPGSQYTQIQPAIDAAAVGDVILIRPNAASYASVTVSKGVVLVGDGGPVTIHASADPFFPVGAMVHDSSASGSPIVFRGLSIEGALVFFNQGPNPVWFDGCDLHGLGHPASSGLGVASAAARVVVTHCQVSGADGGYDGFGSQATSFNARPGLGFGGSSLFAYESSFSGGKGANAAWITATCTGKDATLAGDGVQVSGTGQLLFSNCEITGGDGGDGGNPQCGALPPVCFLATAGGHAIGGSGAVTVRVAAAILTAGTGGAAPCSNAPPPTPAFDVTNGTLVNLPGVPGSFSTASPIRENQSTSLDVSDAAGLSVFLFVGAAPNALLLPKYSGALHVGSPLIIAPLGTIPPSGTLSIPIVVPSLPGGVLGVTVFLQAATCAAGGACTFTAPASVVVLDSSL